MRLGQVAHGNPELGDARQADARSPPESKTSGGFFPCIDRVEALRFCRTSSTIDQNKTMKKTILLLTLALASLCASAQTAPPTPTSPPAAAQAPTPQTFIQSVEGYFSSFDTNSQTFGTNAPYQMWTGVAYQNGINLGAQVGIEGNPFSKWPAFTIGSVSTLAATVGTIAQEEFDFGYSIVHYDVRLTLGAGAVDTFHGGTGPSGIKGSVYASVEKALSANTFAGVRVEGLFGGGSKANVPMFGIFAGFTF